MWAVKLFVNALVLQTFINIERDRHRIFGKEKVKVKYTKFYLINQPGAK